MSLREFGEADAKTVASSFYVSVQSAPIIIGNGKMECGTITNRGTNSPNYDFDESFTGNNLAEIFAISKENEKQDLDNLNYNTSCFGFCRYDTSTLYNRGIKTMENKITDRYEDYPPPTSCCGMLW